MRRELAEELLELARAVTKVTGADAFEVLKAKAEQLVDRIDNDSPDHTMAAARQRALETRAQRASEKYQRLYPLTMELKDDERLSLREIANRLSTVEGYEISTQLVRSILKYGEKNV